MESSQNTVQMQEARMNKAIESINTKLDNIQQQLMDVVLLSERVAVHDKTLTQHTAKLEAHSERLHEIELWQAERGETPHYSRRITDLQNEISSLENKLDSVTNTQRRRDGQTDVLKSIGKWGLSIFAGWLLWTITNNANANMYVTIPVARETEESGEIRWQ